MLNSMKGLLRSPLCTPVFRHRLRLAGGRARVAPMAGAPVAQGRGRGRRQLAGHV